MSLTQLQGQYANLERQLKALGLSDPRRPQVLVEIQRVGLAIRSIKNSLGLFGGLTL